MSKINNYISKLNIVLLVTNLTILGAIIFCRKGLESNKDLNYKLNTDLFIKKELGFTEEQYKKHLELNKIVIKGYERVSELTCLNHYQFLLELSKKDPSINILDSISRVNGKIHTGLKVFTARYYLNIKSICTPEQELKLQQLINEMLQKETCVKCKDTIWDYYIDDTVIVN